jgi:spermidine synthase
MSQTAVPESKPRADRPGGAGRALAGAECTAWHPTALLFLVSVLGLFLELLLIRWIGTEIRIFAYLQNTVLVVCFMGLGMGCLTCRRPIVIREMLLPLGALVLLMAIPESRKLLGHVTEMLSVLGDFLIWQNAHSNSPLQTTAMVAGGLALTLVLVILIWDMFVPLGRLLGRLLEDQPRTIWAYSVNVAGSLVGIWLFVLASALGLPPAAWFACAAALMGVLILAIETRRRRLLSLGLAGSLVLLAWIAGTEPGSLAISWSPYQKLVLYAVDERAGGREPVRDYHIAVNNTGYQAMIDLSERQVAAHPERYPEALRGLSQYDVPFLLHPRPRTALLVGAGAGNDAAGALRHGVEHITAVEIDPAIIALGRRYHPEQPYDSPRVKLVNDDARSYFATSRERFDVIVFGLLDSHTTTAMTNARLDHYVYTTESLARARSLLAAGGIMVLSFEAQKAYVGDRMARELRQIFAAEPIAFRIPPGPSGYGGLILVAGDLESARGQITANARLAAQIKRWQEDEPVAFSGATPVATDDWPYIYLARPRIPLLYFLLAGLLAVPLLRGLAQMGITDLVAKWERSAWHFFLLGSAFMLLEVQNISKAAVVLGNTWSVNAVIISGILAMVLLGNLIVARWPAVPTWPVYAGLCGSCLLNYSLDLSNFAFLPYATKAVLVGGLTSLPMIFSAIIFIQSFTCTPHKDQALGANLIGGLFGGLLQSVTFVTGIRSLLLIVIGLYLGALATQARRSSRAAPDRFQRFAPVVLRQRPLRESQASS